jgi:hypothetical protein
MSSSRDRRARQDDPGPDHPRGAGRRLRTVAGPALEKKDIAAILTAIEPREVLFIDEIHRLNRAAEEILYPALEDFRLDIVFGQGAAARTLTIDLPPFTLVGATTRSGLLTTPLRDRFGMTFRLGYYEPAQLGTIVRRSAGILEVEIDDDAADEIASRSRGTPRIANRSCGGSATSPRFATPARSRTTSPARRSSCSRSTAGGSSASTASCSRPWRKSSEADRSGSRRLP